jgi:CDP-6-deoxy-D-xylo-4-hexulose-3-dehydrase
VIAGLEERKIATRLLFGGNLLRQPAYRDVPHRTVGEMHGADFVMDNVFWIGVYPGLGAEQIDFMIETLHAIAQRGYHRSSDQVQVAADSA